MIGLDVLRLLARQVPCPRLKDVPVIEPLAVAINQVFLPYHYLYTGAGNVKPSN